MSNNKTLISLLFAVAVIALTITVFLPLANIPEQTASTPAFMAVSYTHLTLPTTPYV